MSRVLRALGVVLIIIGVGCVALFFVGPPTTGSIPTTPPSTPSTQSSPTDTLMYLTVPKIGLKDTEVYDSLSEEKLKEGVIHVPGTGFPWQPGTNTYIAGHRLGYFNTGSWLVFYRLNELEPGDEIALKDQPGNEYAYRVRESLVVGPDDVEVLNPPPVAGGGNSSIVSLQTCTLPNFQERLIVRGERVG
jgi:sortase A